MQQRRRLPGTGPDNTRSVARHMLPHHQQRHSHPHLISSSSVTLAMGCDPPSFSQASTGAISRRTIAAACSVIQSSHWRAGPVTW